MDPAMGRKISSRGRPRSRARKTLLVLEDEKLTGWSIRESLGKSYRVQVARSAEEAMELLPRLPRLDAVLADIRLPGMSGLEFSRKLREDRPEVKVFLMTAYSGEAAAREAFAIRADGYLTKPFAMETLKDMLLSHLGSTAP